MSINNMERNELLPILIDGYNLKVGAEIGVREGYHSMHLLDNTNLNVLYGIDIKYDARVELVKKKYPSRFSYCIGSSLFAVNNFEDESLDFIYIDAGHSYNDSKNDIEAWWPKLRKGGLFCGDDYTLCNNPVEGDYDVVHAIEDFVEKHDLRLFITGLGYVERPVRIAYAIETGKKHTDNLWLGYNDHVRLPPHMIEGRVRTEGVPVPQWIVIK